MTVIVEENELGNQRTVSLNDVLQLRKPTADFLTRSLADVYRLQFLRYRLKDAVGGKTIFDIKKIRSVVDEPEWVEGFGVTAPYVGHQLHIRTTYKHLELKRFKATIVFQIGTRGIDSLRMIERQYYRKKLLRSNDIDFGMCAPGSKKKCRFVYELRLTENLIINMCTNPYETMIDTFFFADGELVMQFKSDYAYDLNLDRE